MLFYNIYRYTLDRYFFKKGIQGYYALNYILENPVRNGFSCRTMGIQPNTSRPRLDYDFTTSNGWFTNSRWYSTSEKDISYDENGENPEVLEDQDPAKSIIQFNRHNCITVTDFFDNLTQEYTHFRFVYENCGNVDGNNMKSLQ